MVAVIPVSWEVEMGESWFEAKGVYYEDPILTNS
jgi:hypothetical protein